MIKADNNLKTLKVYSYEKQILSLSNFTFDYGLYSSIL
jgi:hypothetical protein